MEGPEVEFLQDALKRARQAAQERQLANQMAERRFIERSERRLRKINAERAAESAQLNEARSRLTVSMPKPQCCHQTSFDNLQWMSPSNWN